MKLLAIILVAFSLSGCIWQSVNQYDLQDAVKICGSLENIAYVVADFVAHERVVCMDGKGEGLHQYKGN